MVPIWIAQIPTKILSLTVWGGTFVLGRWSREVCQSYFTFREKRQNRSNRWTDTRNTQARLSDHP